MKNVVVRLLVLLLLASCAAQPPIVNADGRPVWHTSLGIFSYAQDQKINEAVGQEIATGRLSEKENLRCFLRTQALLGTSQLADRTYLACLQTIEVDKALSRIED